MDVSSTDSVWRAPLSYAAEDTDMSCLQMLCMQKNVNVNSKDITDTLSVVLFARNRVAFVLVTSNFLNFTLLIVV